MLLGFCIWKLIFSKLRSFQDPSETTPEFALRNRKPHSLTHLKRTLRDQSWDFALGILLFFIPIKIINYYPQA